MVMHGKSRKPQPYEYILRTPVHLNVQNWPTSLVLSFLSFFLVSFSFFFLLQIKQHMQLFIISGTGLANEAKKLSCSPATSTLNSS